jgi:hypothetical protein
MYEVGTALSTSGRERGFVIGELDGKITPRAEFLRDMLQVIAEARVTDNLYGERYEGEGKERKREEMNERR